MTEDAADDFHFFILSTAGFCLAQYVSNYLIIFAEHCQRLLCIFAVY